MGEAGGRKVFKPPPRLENTPPKGGGTGNMSEKAKEKVKSENVQTQIPAEYKFEKDFSQIAKLIPELRQKAIDENSWQEIRLWTNRGYMLEINISPNGNPMLRIVSPSLKNSFVIPNADIVEFLIELAKALEYNKPLVNQIIGLCNKFNERQRKSSRRNIV